MSKTLQDQEIRRIREVLWSLIAWMAQSANSPISPGEASTLLEKLDQGHD